LETPVRLSASGRGRDGSRFRRPRPTRAATRRRPRPDDGVAWSEGFPPIAEPRATIPINPITPTATSADHVTVPVEFLNVLTDVPYVAVPAVGAVAQQLLGGHEGLEIVADGHRGREGVRRAF